MHTINHPGPTNITQEQQRVSRWQRIKNFVKTVVVAAKNKVVKFVKDVYHHWPMATVMVLASIGLSNMLGQLPFWITLPMWVEAALVIPVLSCLIVLALSKVAEWQAQRRLVTASVY